MLDNVTDCTKQKPSLSHRVASEMSTDDMSGGEVNLISGSIHVCQLAVRRLEHTSILTLMILLQLEFRAENQDFKFMLTSNN